MSSSPSRSRSRELAVGIALLGCSLASSAASGQNMANVIVNSFTGSITAGSTSFTYTLSGGPTNLISASGLPVQSGTGQGGAAGQSFYGFFDILFISLETTPTNYTTASGSGSWGLTFTSDVIFADNSGGATVSWLANGQTVNVGDIFAAGAYIFTFTYNYSGLATDFFNAGFIAIQAPTSGVPLPGAAGLAACGLLGLGRRRRR